MPDKTKKTLKNSENVMFSVFLAHVCVHHTLGCLLLSNSNLLLGVQYTVTVITYCNYCGYCQFFKLSSITVCPFEVV